VLRKLGSQDKGHKTAGPILAGSEKTDLATGNVLKYVAKLVNAIRSDVLYGSVLYWLGRQVTGGLAKITTELCYIRLRVKDVVESI